MLGNYFEYPAAYTRTRSVRAKLLSAEDWRVLTESKDLFAALSFLVETEYRDYFEWTSLHADALPSMRRVEHMLRRSTVSYIMKILRFLSGAPADVLVALVHKYELLNIKKTLRRLNQPERREHHLEIENYDLGRYGLVPGTDWDEIKNPGELGRALQPTCYGFAYQKGQSVFSESHDLLLFECTLEKVYYEELAAVVSRLSAVGISEARSLIGGYIDEVCLTTFTRLRCDHEMECSSILPLLPLAGAERIHEQLLLRLSEASDEEDVFELLGSESGWKGMTGVNLRETVSKLRKARLLKCRKVFSHGLSLNVAPAVAFYFLKDEEVAELIALLQSKRFGVELSAELHLVNL